MKGALVSDGLWKVVDGTDNDPERNDQAFYKIVFYVSTSLHPLLMNKDNAKVAWELLEKNFGNSTSNGRLELYQSLFTIKRDQFDNVADYLNAIRGLQGKLVSQKKGLDDETIAYIMLIGLPAQYDPSGMAISSIGEALSSDFVRQKIMNCKPAASDTALCTKVNSKLQSQSTAKKDFNVVCHFCKKAGHIKSDCNKYKEWPEKQKAKAANEQKKEKPKIETAKLAVNIENPVSCDSSGEEVKCMLVTVLPPAPGSVHEPPDLKSTQDAESKAMLTVNGKYTWYVDSGASKHMCNEEVMFQSMQDSRNNIRVANDQLIPCHGEGEVTICSSNGNVKISNVLYVPEL